MSGHTDKHRLFFVWVCSFRMWRGPAGYQCLPSIHIGQEVWEPCYWSWSYLISTKHVTCMPCCTAHIWGHDGWKTKLKNWLKKEQRTHHWVSGNNEVLLHFMGNVTEWESSWNLLRTNSPHEHYAKRANERIRKSTSSQRPLQELGPVSTWLCLRVSAPVPVLAETERLQG